MNVLAVNGGSSSLKVARFSGERRVWSQSVDRVGADEHAAALGRLVDALDDRGTGLEAVGHRFVFGGAFDRAQRLDQEVLGELRRHLAIDPTHLPAELALVDAVERRFPRLPQVACFDTAFHHGMPRVAQLLPIPFHAGVRRYGFHGISYAYLMMELGRLGADGGRVVLAHLGSGASLAAVLDGKCLDTTMSFTPASGVVMGTRSGDLDPGLLVHLMRSENLSPDAVDDLINHRCGLAGVSGGSSDMRDLLLREGSDARAADAVTLFCYSVKKAIGALAAVLGGVDTLVFAGGIGERSAPVRARVTDGLSYLGIRLDPNANQNAQPVLSGPGSTCTVRLIPTDEEMMIAREVHAFLEEKP